VIAHPFQLETPPQWIHPTTRRDGLTIRQRAASTTNWVVLTASGAVIETCPCCGKPLLSPAAARAVADVLCPQGGEP
jgi:hypothetical protein